MRYFAFATLALAGVSPTADAKCARTEQRPVILTTRDTALPDDGGVLVGWATETYEPASDHPVGGDPSDQPAWTATAGKAKVALARTSLAPGLSVYRPAKPAGAEPLVLADKAGKPLGTFTRAAKAPNTMPAPIVVAVKLTTDASMRWEVRHATAKLRSAPPAAAVGLIAYHADKAGNQPISFVRIADTHDTLTTLETFEDAGHCGSIASGSRPPAAGEHVVFAWVDAFGRLSPISTPTTAK